MITLSSFTPAETLLITEGTFPSLRQLLKVTFIDLFFKQVIKTESSVGDNKSSNSEKYILPGRNFYAYAPLPHEFVFIKVFEKYPNTHLLFRHVVELCYKNAGTKKKYLSLIKNSPSMQRLTKQTLLQKITGNFSFTNNAAIIKQKLNQELAKLERELPLLIEENKDEVVEIIKKIKGNLFLLVNIPFEKWDLIDKDILQQINNHSKDNKSYYGCGGGVGCSGCSTWNSFNDYSSSFDSGCGGSDGNSGGGGDSGCSGCGGGGD